MLAYIPDKVQEMIIFEPVIVVDHLCAGGLGRKVEKLLKLLFNT